MASGPRLRVHGPGRTLSRSGADGVGDSLRKRLKFGGLGKKGVLLIRSGSRCGRGGRGGRGPSTTLRLGGREAVVCLGRSDGGNPGTDVESLSCYPGVQRPTPTTKIFRVGALTIELPPATPSAVAHPSRGAGHERGHRARRLRLIAMRPLGPAPALPGRPCRSPRVSLAGVGVGSTASRRPGGRCGRGGVTPRGQPVPTDPNARRARSPTAPGARGWRVKRTETTGPSGTHPSRPETEREIGTAGPGGERGLSPAAQGGVGVGREIRGPHHDFAKRPSVANHPHHVRRDARDAVGLRLFPASASGARGEGEGLFSAFFLEQNLLFYLRTVDGDVNLCR